MNSRTATTILSLVIIATIIVFSFSQATLGLAASDAAKKKYSVEDLISHADTMYWVAMAERGSLTAINYGYEYLDEAESKLKKTKYTKEKKERLTKQISGLRSDLQHQEELAHNTHYGVFPLVRFITNSTLFRDPRSIGSFELIDDPDEVAAREALHELINDVLHAQTFIPQYDVVFVHDVDVAGSQQLAEELKGEALYAFNRSSRFFVHNRLETQRFLEKYPAEEQKVIQSEFGKFIVSQKYLTALLDEFNTNQILFVRIRKVDQAHGDFFYAAEGRFFERSQGIGAAFTSQAIPSTVLNVYGFCIDRRDMLLPIIITHALLFFLSIFLYFIIIKTTSLGRQAPTLKQAVTMGGICFLWGRGLMWILAPTMSTIEPVPETLAAWSFWWPAATGAALLLGPAIIMRVAEHRFNLFGDFFVTFNRYGAIFTCVALGSLSFFAQATMIYKGMAGLPILPPLIMTGGFLAFTAGRAIDNTDPVKFGWVFVVGLFTLLFGLAWSHADMMLTWVALVPAIGIFALSHRSPEKIKTDATKGLLVSTDKTRRPSSLSLKELIELASTPPFNESYSFQELENDLTPWLTDKRTVLVQLLGPAGIGKSTVIKAIREQIAQSNNHTTILCGTCAEPQEGAEKIPFQPFADAISDHFSINLLAPPEDQMKNIDKALGGIFDSVVPFSDILFPPGSNSVSSSQKELFTAIASTIRRLAKQGSVLLVIDDLQWIDPASKTLLEYLIDEFPAGNDFPLAIVLASRDKSSTIIHGEVPIDLEMTPLSEKQLQHVLSTGLHLEHAICDGVLQATDGQRENLHTVFQLVSHLAQKDLLSWQQNNFTWKDGEVDISKALPGDYEQWLITLIKEHPNYQPILEIAACIGLQFSVELISAALERPRLEVIYLLDEIISETGIVKELRQKDDHYAFQSPFMLEALRHVLEVSAHGPHETQAPQRIREYHYRIAHTLSKDQNDAGPFTYTIASHYYASGSRHADIAFDFCIKAAKLASNQFQHDLARKYISMAHDCSDFCTCDKSSLKQTLLLIECREAHVEGVGRVKNAEKGLAFLRDNTGSTFKIHKAVALACYDAGIDTRDQQYFVNCFEIAKSMLQTFKEPWQQAEAEHFCGISLPVTERDAREKHLRTALALLEDMEERDLDSLRLKSRIANSLAEQLSYGSDDERRQAREYFELSVSIKKRADIRDTEGLAFAYGGLGRLAFFAAKPDYETARKHFKQDLLYSKKVGNKTGQSKMHSLLGACELAQPSVANHLQTAAEHYKKAYHLAEERVDSFFALAGLLQCNAEIKQWNKVRQYGEELAAIIREADTSGALAIPYITINNIKIAIAHCDEEKDAEWYRVICEVIEKLT